MNICGDSTCTDPDCPGTGKHQIWRDAHVAEDGTLSNYAKADLIKGLSDYQRAVHRTAVAHGWWGEATEFGSPLEDRNFGEMLMLMTSELAEALEAWRDHDIVTQIRYEYQNGENPQLVTYNPTFVYVDGHKEVVELGKPVGVASEFADVIIRILDTAEKMKIPVIEALIRKHEYNITRPYRHGGKKA